MQRGQEGGNEGGIKGGIVISASDFVVPAMIARGDDCRKSD